MTKVAFEGFPCYSFDEGRLGFLMSDVSIECGTTEHGHVQLVAWLAVIAYPAGIILFCVVLLFKAAPALIAGKETPLTRATAMLHREYDPSCFWWELMEMLRKFLLVGLFVTLEPGSVLQITIGTIVAAAYLMVQVRRGLLKWRARFMSLLMPLARISAAQRQALPEPER